MKKCNYTLDTPWLLTCNEVVDMYSSTTYSRSKGGDPSSENNHLCLKMDLSYGLKFKLNIKNLKLYSVI